MEFSSSTILSKAKLSAVVLRGIILPIEGRNQVPYAKEKSAVLSIEDPAPQVDEHIS